MIEESVNLRVRLLGIMYVEDGEEE